LHEYTDRCLWHACSLERTDDSCGQPLIGFGMRRCGERDAAEGNASSEQGTG